MTAPLLVLAGDAAKYEREEHAQARPSREWKRGWVSWRQEAAVRGAEANSDRVLFQGPVK